MPETEEKFILDATAGFRMMWYDKHHPNTLYIDERAECQPDEIQDYKNLPYPNNSFKLIVFDPPHLIKNPNNISNLHADMVRMFGFLNCETWQSDLKSAFKELWRVLKPEGILLFKWSNSDADSATVLKIIEHKPLFYQITSSRPKMNEQGKLDNRNSRKVRTLWFCFMKIPEKEKS